MANNIKERTEELREDFKTFATAYKLLTDVLTHVTEELQNIEDRDDEALGTASVLIHALLDPTSDFAENELQELENNLENIKDDRKDNFLKLVEGKMSTLNALLMLLNDNVKKLHNQTKQEEQTND